MSKETPAFEFSLPILHKINGTADMRGRVGSMVAHASYLTAAQWNIFKNLLDREFEMAATYSTLPSLDRLIIVAEEIFEGIERLNDNPEATSSSSKELLAMIEDVIRTLEST